MTTLPEEAAFAAAKAITGPLRDPTEWELEQFKRALIAALPFLSVQGAPANACQCTKIQQDETCPVGYPSLLCEICDGKGVVQPSSARELALEEAAKNCEREAAEVEGLIDDVAYHLRKRAAAIRALSSPDHADANLFEILGKNPHLPKDGVKPDMEGIKSVVGRLSYRFPDHADTTDEMVEAALAVDWDNEDERATVHNIWHAMAAKLPTAPDADAGKVEGDGWLPIESAPKDGTEIIYLTKYGSIGFCRYAVDDINDWFGWWDVQADDEVYPKFWLPRSALPSAPSEGAE